MIITEQPRKQLKEFLIKYKDVLKIDPDEMYEMVCGCMRLHKRGETHELIKQIEDRWYKSLDNGSPDYSVYSDPNYIADLWGCWIVGSRQYIKSIINKRSLDGTSIAEDLTDYKSVLDIGCGFGYSTAALAEVFPDKEVYGTNLKDTFQYEIATNIGEQYGFTIGESLKQADILFASEYFEHFERPIEHLEHVIRSVKPKAIILANSFDVRAIGHFNTHYYREAEFTAKQMKKLFLEHLRKMCYNKIKTKCWNQRPLYFKLIEDQNLLNFM